MVAELMTVSPDDPTQQVGYIPLEKIHAGRNIRREVATEADESFAELVNSIKMHGIRQAIEVTRRVDGDYDLLVGHRRYAAAERLGLTTVPCQVRDANEEERAIIQLTENKVRRNLSLKDEAEAYLMIINQRHCSIKDVAGIVGIHYSTVARNLRIYRSEELRVAVESNLIGPAGASRLLQLREDYSVPLWSRLRSGMRVTAQEVEDAHRRQKEDGIPELERSSQHDREDAALMLQDHGLSKEGIAAALGVTPGMVWKWLQSAKARDAARSAPSLRPSRQERLARVSQMQSEGMRQRDMAKALGVDKTSISEDVKLLRALSAREQPNVTLNGRSLDKRIADADAENPSALPRRPDPKNLLPWERPAPSEPTTRLAYSVDPAGVVLDVKTEPKTPRPTPTMEAQPVTLASPRIEPSVEKLRDLIAPMDEATFQVFMAILNVGIDQVWPCSRLWSKLAQARVLVKEQQSKTK